MGSQGAVEGDQGGGPVKATPQEEVSLHAAMVEYHGIAHSRDKAQENGSDRLSLRHASSLAHWR